MISVIENKSLVGWRKGERLREFPSNDGLWEGVMRRVVKAWNHHLKL